MLFKTEICHENKISFYKGPYYFNMLCNTSLISYMLEVILELNDILGIEMFFNFSNFLDNLHFPVF